VSSFDYQSNPYYRQVAANVASQGAAEAGSTRDSIRQALIQYGLVPQNFQDKLGALDDTSRSLIGKATESGVSTHARLIEQRQQAIRNLVTRLTARGLRRSGAKGYGLRKKQLDFDRQQSDALGQLLGGVNSMYLNYGMGEFGRQQSLANAMSQVFQNFYGGGGGGSSNFGSLSPTPGQYADLTAGRTGISAGPLPDLFGGRRSGSGGGTVRAF